MVVQSPVELALHQQVLWLCQPLWNGSDPVRGDGPVLAADTVTATDGLLQYSLAIDQRDGNAVDFGLHPDVSAITHPAIHLLGFMEFIQAGVWGRVYNRA